MHKIKLTLLAFPIMLISFTSCKKKIYGCMDVLAENYSPVANEDSKSCIYPAQEEVYSTTFNNQSWSLNGSMYEMILDWNSITQSVLDNGGLIAYIRISGSEIWEAIPLTLYLSDAYSSTIGFSYSLKQARLTWTDSDLVTPATPPTTDIKLVIVK